MVKTLKDLFEKKAYVNMGQGTDIVFKVAWIGSMSDKEVSENVEAAFKGIQVVLKEKGVGPEDIRRVYLKTYSSPSLPILT